MGLLASEYSNQSATDMSLEFPFEGGQPWKITSDGGYNNTHHKGYQEYSLDLERQNGLTTGESVLAGVSGTYVHWEDKTGCFWIRIDAWSSVPPYWFLMTCHINLQFSKPVDGPVIQGEVIGTVAGPGDKGYRALPHIHITLYRDEHARGSGSNRNEMPFSSSHGGAEISSYDFPPLRCA